MSDPESMKRIGGLLKDIVSVDRGFLDRCCRVTTLAITDYQRAVDECLALAAEVANLYGDSSEDACRQFAVTLKDALRSGQLDQDLVSVLKSLRQQYLCSVLQPAVKEFLSSDSESRDKIERLYERALAIDGLLDVVSFFQRLPRS